MIYKICHVIFNPLFCDELNNIKKGSNRIPVRFGLTLATALGGIFVFWIPHIVFTIVYFKNKKIIQVDEDFSAESYKSDQVAVKASLKLKKKNPLLVTAQASSLLTPECCVFEKAERKEVLALQKKMQRPYPKLKIKKLSNYPDCFPEHKLQIGDTTYYVSNVFTTHHHFAVFALVKIGNKVFPRIFYRSNSQASWRLLPSFEWDRHKIYKGHMESDTMLPIALNLALYNLPKSDKWIPSIGDDCILNHKMDKGNPIYTEVIKIEDFAAIKANEEGSFTSHGGMYCKKAPNPAAILLPEDENLLPNFDHCLHEMELESELYGNLAARVFPSRNENLQYLFLEASDGRAFLCSVEQVVDNPITSFGIRKKGLDLKGLDSPLMEYRSQQPHGYIPPFNAPIYNCRKEDYSNNWNYVRELAIIQDYYSERELSVPDAF